MNENCENCMKSQEQIYWDNFKSLRFYQILLPGFHNHLYLPQQFSIHLKKKLLQNVTLISPKGTKYIVRVEEDSDNKLSFDSGWDEFAKDNSLEVNDLLFFKFCGGSEFKVLVFDGQTLCEIPSSYFVKECGHAEKKIKVSQNGYEQEVHSNSGNVFETLRTALVAVRKKMDEKCEHCMKSEDQIYWEHFKSLRFYQILLPGFHNHLYLPSKFSIHLKKKLLQNVTLISPKGTTYIVRIEEDGDNELSFRSGWKEFTKDHSLEVNDLLFFKFRGGSEFKVLVFNGQTLCEKPSSYFAKECGHAEKKIKVSQSGHEQEVHINSENDTTSSQPLVVSPTSSGQISEGKYFLGAFKKMQGQISNPNLDLKIVSQNSYEQEGHINSDNDTTSPQPLVVSPTSSGRISEVKYSLGAFKKMREQTSNPNLDCKDEDVRAFKKMRGQISNPNLDHNAASSEKRALSLAKRAISENGFLVVMRPTHVLRIGCFLDIPSQWCIKNKLLSNQQVVMQVGESETKWVMNLKVIGTHGRISGGWKKFAKNNKLRLNDVCVFEPANSETMPFHILVSIFRDEEAESTNNVSQNGYEQEVHINSDNDTTSSHPLVVSPTSSGQIGEGKYSFGAFKRMRGQISNPNLDCSAGKTVSDMLFSASSEKRALSLAKRAVSENGFLVVMRPTHVLTIGCFIDIPAKWCMKNMLLSNQQVVMQVRECETKWVMNLKASGSCGRIYGGWKKFARDNELRLNDVCVFEPAANSETKPFHILVSIFRDEEAESTNNG